MLNECRSKKPKNELKDSSRMKYNMVGCWMLQVSERKLNEMKLDHWMLSYMVGPILQSANLLFYLLTSEM